MKNTIIDNKRFTKLLIAKLPNWRYFFEILAKLGLTHIPLDQTLGVEGTAFSPGVRRMMARSGSRTSFTDASEDLCVYARLDITPKQIQRVSEDVGRAVEDWICKQKPEPQKTGEMPAHSVATATSAVPKFYVSFDGISTPDEWWENAS